MSRGKGLLLPAILSFALTCAGCAVPRYDVPYKANAPTVRTIVERIQCEIAAMVRDEKPTYPHRPFLLNNDFDIVVSMSIEVNDTGGLAPSLAYMNPVTNFTFGANATLSESRDHTFTENLQFSVREIYLDLYMWELAKRAGVEDPQTSYGFTQHACPPADTELAGTLGISDFVSMASTSEGLTTSAEKVFGGSIQFIVTKNVNAVGPTWTLVHFKGPGGLFSASQVNTDKITLAFAQGPNVGTKMLLPTKLPRVLSGNTEIARARGHRPNGAAYSLLQQMLTSSINSQLVILQNNLQNGFR